jgi:nucleoid-associated protein YgaU
MFFAGCQPTAPKPATGPMNPPVIQGPPTSGDMTSEVPPGTGTSTTVLPPAPSDNGGPGPIDTSGARTYTVKAHDGLMGIARSQLGNEHRWKEILAINPEIKDPNQLKVGQVIKLPAK